MGDASGAASGNDPNANNGGAGGGDPKKDEVVPKADHQRALDDMHKFKKLASDAEKERNDLKTRLEALENAKKTEAGDFKGLYESTKAKLDEIEAEKKRLKDSMVLTQKHSAVQTALSKSGFKPEFMPLLDKETFDDVVFEMTNQGRMIVTGADNFVDQYRKKYPSAFEAAKAPVVNTGGGKDGGGPQELTIEYMNSIEKKEPAKYKELWPTFLEQWRKREAQKRTS